MSSKQDYSIDIRATLALAHQLYEKNYLSKCIEVCIYILSIEPKCAEAWSIAASIMIKQERFQQAIEYFKYAIKLEPQTIEYRINLAEAYRRAKNAQEAIKTLRLLLSQYPKSRRNATLHFNLARAYSDIELFNASIKHYTIAIKLDPNDLGAMFNLANAKVSLKQFGQAIELYLYAFQRGYLDAGVNLANTYSQMGLFKDALDMYEKIFSYYKEDSDFIFNYANTLGYSNADLECVKAMYKQAIKQEAKTEYVLNYALFLLKNYHFKEGFALYEVRKKLPNMLPKGIDLLWDGKGLHQQSVLVYYEQGLGDSIMFARFLPQLENIAKQVCVLIQEPLLSLMHYLGIESYAHLDEINLSRFDCAISLLSLPLALGIENEAQIATRPPLLQFLSCRCLPRDEMQPLKVGICFSTDSDFKDVENKNIPLEVLIKAFDSSMELHSLNKAQVDSALLEKYHIINHISQVSDFVATLRLIKTLDIVVSIDTAVAHLSASMGKSTIVLLNKRYDWRWGNGVNTKWYDNVICITQSKMGDWSDVISHLHSYMRGFSQNILNSHL